MELTFGNTECYSLKAKQFSIFRGQQQMSDLRYVNLKNANEQ